MRTINQWLDEYGESHQHPFNKLIHWICVPAIMFSLFGLLYSIPFFSEKSWYANWGAIVMIPILFFYLRLSKVMFISFVGIGFLLLKGNDLLYNKPYLKVRVIGNYNVPLKKNLGDYKKLDMYIIIFTRNKCSVKLINNYRLESDNG